LAIDSASLEVW